LFLRLPYPPYFCTLLRNGDKPLEIHGNVPFSSLHVSHILQRRHHKFQHILHKDELHVLLMADFNTVFSNDTTAIDLMLFF
jgi:hypothetical protein